LTPGAAPVQVPLTAGLLNYGLFYGTSAGALSQTPATPLGVNSTTGLGLISVANGSAYQLAGTEPGQSVFIQIRAWSASFGSDWQRASTEGTYWGQTDVKAFILGASSGPGVVLWSNSDTTKFRPMLINIVPEPSTIALGVLGLGSLLFFRRRQAK